MHVEQNRECSHGTNAKGDLAATLHTSQQSSTVLYVAGGGGGGSSVVLICLVVS
jgi:hypothetical protein